MPSTIVNIPAAKVLRTLVVESSADETSPVLLFLHGRGEASEHLNEIPKVGFHLSPPFRAAMGWLMGAIVIAPQAPHKKEDENWNWRDYARPIGDFLHARFGKRRIVAAGFSRGGLGVLQLVAVHPDLVSKWAIVDPQHAADDAELRAVLPKPSDRERGWLRFGNELRGNTPFSEQVAQALLSENSHFVDMKHGELAMEAFGGNALGGTQNLYDFLGLDHHDPHAT